MIKSVNLLFLRSQPQIMIIVYLILVLTVGVVSLAKGFRTGITNQLASLLGFAFGAVGSRVLNGEFVSSFGWVSGLTPAPELNHPAASLVCGATIYFVVFSLFSILSGLLRGAMSVFETGMFNRLLGAFFCCLKNLLWLSIFFNLLLCFSPKSELLRFERANDGNLVSAVMEMTPAILGCVGGEDFAHINQLREAKKISCNFRRERNVILTQA